MHLITAATEPFLSSRMLSHLSNLRSAVSNHCSVHLPIQCPFGRWPSTLPAEVAYPVQAFQTPELLLSGLKILPITMQVGLCSGLVLGLLASMLAVHFWFNRRSSSTTLASKLSTDHTGGFSSSFYSPGEFYPLSKAQHPCMVLKGLVGLHVMFFLLPVSHLEC